jgi:hypothetical protein
MSEKKAQPNPLIDVERVADSKVYLPALLVGLEFHRGLGLQRGISSQVLYNFSLGDPLVLRKWLSVNKDSQPVTTPFPSFSV